MKTVYKKYLIISFVGALILGLSFYLFLNSRLDSVEIAIAAEDIQIGKVLAEDDLTTARYYESAIPEDCILDMEELIGERIQIYRKKGDFFSADMLDEKIMTDIKQGLKKGEVLVSVIPPPEDLIVREIKVGDLISIVSTKKTENMIMDNPSEGSPGISIIEEQLIIRDLQVLKIEKIQDTGNMLYDGGLCTYVIYLGCDFKKVSMLASMTRDEDYKIFLEKKI